MSNIYIDGRSYQTDMVEAYLRENSNFDVHIMERAFEELSKYQHGLKGRCFGETPERHLIDKKDLVSCLMENYKYPWTFDDMINKISQIPFAGEDHPWIPVSAGMPDEWMRVWLTIRYPSGYLNTEEGKWEGSFKHRNGKEIKYSVVAWKPYQVPEAYKAVKGEEK